MRAKLITDKNFNEHKDVLTLNPSVSIGRYFVESKGSTFHNRLLHPEIFWDWFVVKSIPKNPDEWFEIFVTISKKQIQRIAEVCHEANRAQQVFTGEEINPPWRDLSEELWLSIIKGVNGVVNEFNGPEESHKSWCKERWDNGWVFGETKNIERKIHPCLIPYEDLSDEHKLKDHIFYSIATTMANQVRNNV